MSLNNESDDTRRKLYHRFRQELMEHEASIFFDEDELVEIYDQASDLDDEFVKFNVLMHGFRLYPQSEALAARRGYYMFSYDVKDGIDHEIKHHGTGSTLWQILRLRSMAGTVLPHPAEQMLDEILCSAPDELDDETIIQLVDCASALGAYDWLKVNEKTLRKKCTYLPSLLYELQIVAGIAGDRPYAIRCLEELTEIEPFVIDYWVILSEEQLAADDVDGALASADYALAIDSAHDGAIMAKARALTFTEKRPKEVISLLKGYMESHPLTEVHSFMLRLYVTALIDCKEIDKSIDLLTAFFHTHPDDREVVNLLLLLHYADITDILSAHFAADPAADETEWVDWARTHYHEGHFPQAAMILECFDHHSGLSTVANRDLYISSLYCAKFYNVLAAMLDCYVTEEDTSLYPELVLTGLLSLLRLGKKGEAKKMLRRVMAMHPLESDGTWSVNDVLRSVGYASQMALLIRALDQPGRLDIDEIDPFTPPVSSAD